MDLVLKDGRSICQFTMNYVRMDISGALASLPETDCEYIRIKASNANAAVLVYIGDADVLATGVNGFELGAGDGVSIGGGLGSLIEANSIYVRATGDAVIYYMTHA